MSSRSRDRLASAAAMVLALAACDRENRESRAAPFPEVVPSDPQEGVLQAGATAEGRVDPRTAREAAEYEKNAYHISEGQRLFGWMNCNGCHSNGGGGMGPALMDAQWRYGGQINEIVDTIGEGRPNGMPSYRGKITDQQVWQIAAYVRSLSGQPRKDALAGRTDGMSSIPPLSQAKDLQMRRERP
jgi:cytochrome c oxidase cbb3-type subunit III